MVYQLSRKSAYLTFDDVLLLPAHSEILPSETNVSSLLMEGFPLQSPILSAAMDTITESRMAIRLAQLGGLGFIHKNQSIEAQAEQVERVKLFENGIVQNPQTLRPTDSLATFLRRKEETGFSSFPVVESSGKLVGIITRRDTRFEKDTHKAVAKIMTPKDRLVVSRKSEPLEKIQALMHTHRLERIPLVDKDFRLEGLVTARDFLTVESTPLATKDDNGNLRVGAALGATGDTLARAEALLAKGTDILLLDSSHGHSENVLKTLRTLRKTFPHARLIGGNVATAEGALALVDAGVDAVKVGIGAGSICTTRIVTGVGVPQLSALFHVAAALEKKGVPFIADGGIRFSGDLSKAFATGTAAVMLGSLLAGTDETPGTLELYRSRAYKVYRGMGSVGAMNQGSADRYFQADHPPSKFVPEGVEGRVPYKGPLEETLYQLIGGLRASMGLTGCPDLKALGRQASFIRISPAGRQEGHVHTVSITKEAPNYPTGDGTDV